MQRFIVQILSLTILSSPGLSAQSTWARQTSGSAALLHAVAFFDTATGIAAGSGGTILRSADGGRSWSPRASGTTSPMYDLGLSGASGAVTVGEPSCFDAACGKVRRSTDGGLTWTHVYSGGLAYGVSFAGPLHGIAVGGGYDFGGSPHVTVDRTTDGGATWFSYSSLTYPLAMIMEDVSFVDTGFCVAVANENPAEAKILRSRDGGQTWTLLDSIPSAELYAVDFIDSVTGLAVGASGLILGSTDGGQSWQPQTSGTLSHLRSVVMLSAAEAHAAGDGGTILFTSDGGATWLPEVSRTSESIRSLFFSDAAHGWAAGANGTILKYGEFSGGEISGDSLEFGGVVEGEERRDSVLVANTGTDTLVVSSAVSGSAEFAVDPPGAALPPGASAFLHVVFAPADPGPESAEIVFTHNGPTSPDTVTATGVGLDYGVSVLAVAGKWNLVSLPRAAASDSVVDLFPSAVTQAFRFDPDSGYAATGVLEPGPGYWLKFASAESIAIGGITISSDSIEVHQGWNLIGSISFPVSTFSITGTGGATVASPYYGYSDGYFVASVLEPGRAYWVKVFGDGYLILSGP